MCLELVSEEELVHALEFCGITPAKNPTDLSRDSVARLVSIMKTPILRDTPELVFSSVQDLLGIAGLSHKERVLDTACSDQDSIRFVLAANFSAVALYAFAQDAKKHAHFKSENVINALVYLITNGQPFGQFYAIQTLVTLLRSPSVSDRTYFTQMCMDSALLSALVDCTHSLDYDWQLDASAVLIEVLFNNVSGGVCLFETTDPTGRVLPVRPHPMVQLVNEAHQRKQKPQVELDQEDSPVLHFNHKTALAILIYLVRKLHNSLWCSQPFVPDNLSGVSGAHEESFVQVTRAIIAVLRFPSIRECMDEARVLCTIASIFAAQDSATIAPSHECLYLLLEVVILCMTPLSSDIMSVRNQVFLENADLGALLRLDFFCILARLLLNTELLSPEMTKRLLICFALISRNSTYRMNCLNSLTSISDAEGVSIFAILSRLLDDPVYGADVTIVHLLLTILSGFCTNRQFRQAFYSNTALIGQVVKALRQTLSSAIDLLPVITEPSAAEKERVLSSQYVMSVLTAAMNESSADDDAKDESSSLMTSLRASSMTGSLGESLRESLLGASELKSTDVHFTNNVHMKHSHIFDTKSSRRAAIDLGKSIHFHADGDFRANTAVTLNLAPVSSHMKVFFAASELISTICVDYGILIDFTQVNFYNPRSSSNSALGEYAKVLLNSFFPYFIELSEFLRSLVTFSPAFILEPIMEVVLGALYEISQLDLALVPFLSGQTDIVLLRNKFRLCTRRRMPVLTPLEVRALRCLILFVRNSRIVSLSLFTCALLRKADCCSDTLSTEETTFNVFFAVKHAQAYMDRLKYIHFGDSAHSQVGPGQDWTVLRKAATGPICDIATEASTLLALMTAETPDAVSAEAAAATLNLWNCLFVTNPNEMEFVFNSIAYMLKEWPKDRRGSLRRQLGCHSLEKLVDDIWGRRTS
ncbi:Hypothetical protein DHA2_10608 [Giardia duodenalis]|uniref:Uncharacterized protein n=1 Tax=Giardia intestinalis TaxID=5741 RepID=V6TDL6_GIAIN|nr:Hypothetical protein DHA2_10608 [Giardia intestinalis]